MNLFLENNNEGRISYEKVHGSKDDKGENEKWPKV